VLESRRDALLHDTRLCINCSIMRRGPGLHARTEQHPRHHVGLLTNPRALTTICPAVTLLRLFICRAGAHEPEDRFFPSVIRHQACCSSTACDRQLRADRCFHQVQPVEYDGRGGRCAGTVPFRCCHRWGTGSRCAICRSVCGRLLRVGSSRYCSWPGRDIQDVGELASRILASHQLSFCSVLPWLTSCMLPVFEPTCPRCLRAGGCASAFINEVRPQTGLKCTAP